MPMLSGDPIRVDDASNGAPTEIVALEDGGFAVAWADDSRSPSGDDFGRGLVRTYRADLTAESGEIPVLPLSVRSSFSAPMLMTATAEGFVVGFRGGEEFQAYKLERFTNAGAAVDGSVQSIANTPLGTAALLSDGRVAFGLSGGGSIFGGGFVSFVQSADGTSQTSTTTVASVNQQPIGLTVAALTNGNYVGLFTTAPSFGIRGQILNAQGVEIGPEFDVYTVRNGPTGLPERGGRLEAVGLSTGGFVVVYQTQGQTVEGAGDDAELYARRFDANGVALDVAQRVNVNTLGSQTVASLAATAGGGFVVAYSDDPESNGSQAGRIRVGEFDPDGARVGGELTIQTSRGGGQPHLAVLEDGRAVVAYSSVGVGEATNGVFVQVLTLGAAPSTTPSSGDDVLTGTPDPDVIDALAGNDVIRAGGGGDAVRGGAGDDRVEGGEGDDLVLGNGGDDVLLGGAGNDGLNGNGGDDEIDGGEGDDGLLGKDGNDVVRGGGGDDRMSGGEGGDDMDGGSGDDGVFGEAGDDLLSGGAGEDRVYGGEGNDTVDGGADNDLLGGDAGDDTVRGGAGKDRLDGGEGNDDLFGDGGNDTLRGGAGEDALDGGAGRDRLLGGAGADRLTGGGDKDVFDLTGNLGAADVATDFDGAAGDRFALGGGLFTTLTLTDADGDGDLDTRLEHADGVVIVLGVDDASLAAFNAWVI